MKALDGYSQVSIENNTTYDLKLNSLTNNEVAGKIKITDTSRSGNSRDGFHVTEIERLGNTIHTTIKGDLTQTNGRNTTYAPKANQVYRFETSQNRLETEYWRRVQRGTALNTIVQIVYNTYHEEREDRDPKNEAQGVVRLTPHSRRLEANVIQTRSYQFEKLEQNTVDDWRSSWRHQGVSRAGTYRSWHYEKYRSYQQIHRHSIDADRAIAIEFIGYDEGIVDVKSRQSDVILDGILRNSGGPP